MIIYHPFNFPSIERREKLKAKNEILKIFNPWFSSPNDRGSVPLKRDEGVQNNSFKNWRNNDY